MSRIKKLFNDEQAVSPVIGVILMLAIVVILGGVVAAFALGFTDDVADDTVPTADVSIEADGDDWILAHNGGNDVDLSQLTVVGDDGHENYDAWLDGSPDETFGAGQEHVIDEDGVDGLDDVGDDGITILWSSDGSGDDAEVFVER